MASRASSTAQTASGQCCCSRQATSTPAMPAPTTSTSRSSGGPGGTSAAVSAAGSVWVTGEVGDVGSVTASGYCGRAPADAVDPTTGVVGPACDDWGMTTLSDFTATTLSGQERNLSDYAGQVVLVVNTASACGFTPQYAAGAGRVDDEHHLAQ